MCNGEARRSGGERHGKTEREFEYYLYIGTIAGPFAVYSPHGHDRGGGAYGLWENDSGELVSGTACQDGKGADCPHKHIFGQPGDFLEKRAGCLARAGLDFLESYACPVDEASEGLLVDACCHALAGKTAWYIFVDDFHLLKDRRGARFLCTLAHRLPENVHVIVASREHVLRPQDIVRLGRRICRVGISELKLHDRELAVYAHRCGMDLTDAQATSLMYSGEGWFSAIYLHLKHLLERGTLPDPASDIYAMFTAALIAPLPEKEREFLIVMGLADEFTVEMAQAVTGDEAAGRILAGLVQQNAFVRCLSDGVTYRFHHMMKTCAERCFSAMEPERQKQYWERFGIWYEAHKQYLHALAAYRKSGNQDALLSVIQKDAGILLASLPASDVLDMVDHCSAETLKAHPFALLVLMRRMFTWRQIPKMMELKELLLASMEEHTELSAEERGNWLGECDLIMSFLHYNDISAMSRLHRSASRQMSRLAVSIRNSGGWTYGSPSVLMMFHRAPGELSKELAEMNDCMPHYYKVTSNHGQGAEIIMEAEAAYMQGRLTDAHIALERAYAQIEGNGQENMLLCCDFLSRRLSIYADVEERYTLEERYRSLLPYHDASWIQIWSATAAYYYALQGQTDHLPEMFAKHRMSHIHILAPGRPMMDMIENQVYLAQGAYAKVVGRSAKLLALCEGMHYALVALHIRIQTAIAYEKLGKQEEAMTWFAKVLSDAAPDGFVMPFIENYGDLSGLLARSTPSGLTEKILVMGEAAKARRERNNRPAALAALTTREFEIVSLMVQWLSNREIAEKLFLSEGSVKQYANQIYAKLHIMGDTRTKRRQLADLLGR